MVAIRIDRWQGLAPHFNRRQVPIGAAQIAKNLRFDSGDLRPLQKAVSSGLANLGTSTANIGNLFWYRRGDKTRTIAFGEAMHVTGARSPVPSDSHNRFYYNVSGSSNENGLFAVDLTDPDNPYPGGSTGSGSEYRDFGGYKVGIPAPKEAPVATPLEADLPEAGFGTTNAISSLSRTNPITVNTDGEHGFEVGQRVRLKVDESYPRPADDESGGEGDGEPPENGSDTNSVDGQVWSLDGLEGAVSNVQSNSFDISGVSATSFDEFTENDLDALNVKRILTDSDLESRAYVFTYVNEFDEEGPPSEPSNIIDVMKEGQVELQVGDLAYEADDGGSRQHVDRIRVYRTVSGENTLFVFVGTIRFDENASDDSAIVWTSSPNAVNPALEWSETLKDPVESVSLGEPLPSTGWYPPPSDLEGILMMPNGIMAGWRGNELHFTEPYMPHAWNPDYRKTLDHDIVGAEVAAGVMVVGTHGRPYVVYGADPSSMQDRKLEQHAPLMHPRAICDAGSGVLYAAEDGLVFVTSSGAQKITQKWGKHDWLPVVKNRDRMTFFDGYAFLFAPGQEPLVLSLVGNEAEASYLEEDLAAAARVDNSLGIVKKQTATSLYRNVQFFNEDSDAFGDPVRMTGRHRSGLVAVRRPLNLSVGQVFADGYPVTLKIRSLKPSTYPDPVDGQPDLEDFQEDTYTVKGPEPFRLQPGFLSREFEFEIETEHRIEDVLVTTSMDDLRSQNG